jgi:hypothetical protein
MAFHGQNKILSTRSGLKLEFGVQRVEPEEVPMRAVLGWRAGASVADALEIIPTLYRAVGEARFRRHAFRQFGGRRRKIVENPMRKCAGRRVGVLTNQRETLCVWRYAAPPQGRGEVIAVAGILCRNRFPLSKGVAGDQNIHSLLLSGCDLVVAVRAGGCYERQYWYQVDGCRGDPRHGQSAFRLLRLEKPWSVRTQP